MDVLQNTLYVTSEESQIHKEGETLVVKVERETKLQVPIHHLQAIVCMGRTYVSPEAMSLCLDRAVTIVFMSEHGRFRGRVEGISQAGVMLRLDQFRAHVDQARSLQIARAIVAGKIANQRHVLQRAARETSGVDAEAISGVVASLIGNRSLEASSHDEARGIEGEAAARYFGVFGRLIRKQRDDFQWNGRNRRPPRDPINALLSFSYALLLGDCLAATQAVGLDPAIGFLHAVRPGRPALALDLMEHLRPLIADRLVLTLINNGQVRRSGFRVGETGGVEMDDDTRKTVIAQHQERKAGEVRHPLLEREIPWGLVPLIEARLLARVLRGDLDAFPPIHPKG